MAVSRSLRAAVTIALACTSVLCVSATGVSQIISLAESEGGVQRHPVILMHNQPIGNPATVGALPVIIRYFQRHGYHFVKL